MRSMQLCERQHLVILCADTFQSSCVPEPSRIIQVLNDCMPSIAVQVHLELQDMILNSVHKLDSKCESVDDFVVQLLFLEKVLQQMPDLESRYKHVSRLFSIVLDFNLTVDPEQKALFRTLAGQFQHLKVFFLVFLV